MSQVPQLSVVEAGLRYVGRVGTLVVCDYKDSRNVKSVAPGIGIHVRILDAKAAYGRTLVLVAPLAGEGALWTDARKIRIHDEQDPPPPAIPPVDAARTQQQIDLPIPQPGGLP